jgi:hypothetical protein
MGTGRPLVHLLDHVFALLPLVIGRDNVRHYLPCHVARTMARRTPGWSAHLMMVGPWTSPSRQGAQAATAANTFHSSVVSCCRLGIALLGETAGTRSCRSNRLVIIVAGVLGLYRPPWVEWECPLRGDTMIPPSWSVARAIMLHTQERLLHF